MQEFIKIHFPNTRLTVFQFTESDINMELSFCPLDGGRKPSISLNDPYMESIYNLYKIITTVAS